jgi:hypothetical protein
MFTYTWAEVPKWPEKIATASAMTKGGKDGL